MPRQVSQFYKDSTSVYNDPALLKSIMDVEKDVFGGYIKKLELPLTISEDFGHITANVPSLFVTLALQDVNRMVIFMVFITKPLFLMKGRLMYGLYFLYNLCNELECEVLNILHSQKENRYNI